MQADHVDEGAARQLATKPVVFFGSAKPVTCAVMDYTQRLASAINAIRPGTASVEIIEPGNPRAFIRAIADVLRKDHIAHLQFPIEGWGNSVVPGSALLAARMMTRRGHLVATMHEWTSLHPLRYASMIPDLMAIDHYVFVSAAQRASFQSERLVSNRKRHEAPVIPIGPNIMPVPLDEDAIAASRTRLAGKGDDKADLVVAFFGVLYSSKRPELLLDATKALHGRGVKARLLICGDFLWDKPHDRTAFFSHADALGVRGWVDFRGRIEDDAELMTTLAGADVMLLPYTDGISARRGTFQATARLPMPLVSTVPQRDDEFDFSPLIRKKIEHPSTLLVPAASDADVFAEALIRAAEHKGRAIGVDLFGLWQEAAVSHLSLYDRVLAGQGESAAPASRSPAAASSTR